MGRIFQKARFAQVQWRVWSGALMCILLWARLARLMERLFPQLTCTKKKDPDLVGRCLIGTVLL